MKLRLAELAMITLIGDGAVGAVLPRRHVRRWQGGPKAWRKAMEPFTDNPQLTRALGVAQVVVGLAVAARLPSRP